jgi:hypothetical protein
VGRVDVDRAEEDAFRVVARDRHHTRCADRRPGGAKRREEAEERPVGDQDDVAPPNSRSQATANSPFFCPR